MNYRTWVNSIGFWSLPSNSLLHAGSTISRNQCLRCYIYLIVCDGLLCSMLYMSSFKINHLGNITIWTNFNHIHVCGTSWDYSLHEMFAVLTFWFNKWKFHEVKMDLMKKCKYFMQWIIHELQYCESQAFWYVYEGQGHGQYLHTHTEEYYIIVSIWSSVDKYSL